MYLFFRALKHYKWGKKIFLIAIKMVFSRWRILPLYKEIKVYVL